jgi:diguanylate cyclase
VPVSIMGRTVGVIHATGDPQAAVEDDRVDDLATLAKLAGARIGLLRVMAETQLQASTDTLTGLFNRRAFSEQIGAIPPNQHPVAVAMADLDHFKTLNDTYGHETGDRALRLFARVLRDSLRSSDVVSRYGGEEFAIVLPRTSLRQACTVGEQIRSAVMAKPLMKRSTGEQLGRVTISVGLSTLRPDDTPQSFIERADAALYAAKRMGRNRVICETDSAFAAI